MSEHNERRRFHRILFDAPCELHQGDHVWDTQVLDISLKGVLIRRPEPWRGNTKKPFEVIIHLQDDAAIVMAVELKHAQPRQLGCQCQYIDVESATHLRRLVELNLGDETLLHRDLQALGEDD